MQLAGGTSLSAQGDYIQNLVSRCLASCTALLSLNEGFQNLVGATHRVTDLLLVIEELERDRDMAAQKRNEASRTHEQLVDGSLIAASVDLVTPDGTCLARNLSFSVSPGTNLSICGPNGCGKSSLWRILCRLWRMESGALYLPSPATVGMISQQQLVTLGPIPFIDYCTYPNVLPSALYCGREHESELVGDIRALLIIMQVEYLVNREGWGQCEQWADLLSHGEQQCISCVRALHHAPRWLLMDECTSAVSVDIEAALFRYAATQGIALLSFCSPSRAGELATLNGLEHVRCNTLELGIPSECGFQYTEARALEPSTGKAIDGLEKLLPAEQNDDWAHVPAALFSPRSPPREPSPLQHPYKTPTGALLASHISAGSSVPPSARASPGPAERAATLRRQLETGGQLSDPEQESQAVATIQREVSIVSPSRLMTPLAGNVSVPS
jgi:ABC-type dipeptide/oligopeptide/nickel transport system ATPase subunit